MNRMLKYKKRVDGYLSWKIGNFLRPSFRYNENGENALTLLKRWESEGISLPDETSEPELLSDYVQGKKCRDWHITQWREGIRDRLFLPYEFIGVLGCTEENYRRLLLDGR